jgi:outer membrane lipoprotein-sorting protein
MRRALLLAMLVTAGCPPPAPVERPYAPPTGQELLTALRARADRIATLRAEARADEMGPGGERVKVTVNLLFARPGKMRIEAESPLGGTVATLVADGQRFALLDTRENRFLAGPARACNVARLIRVELPPEELVSTMMGGAPLDGEVAGVGWDKSHGGREVLDLRAPDGGSERLLLGNGRNWDILEAERRDAGGTVRWRIRHEDFEDVGGLRLPRRTTLEEPPHKADVRIRYREVTPNVDVKPAQFQLEPPAGLKVETSFCG